MAFFHAVTGRNKLILNRLDSYYVSFPKIEITLISFNCLSLFITKKIGELCKKLYNTLILYKYYDIWLQYKFYAYGNSLDVNIFRQKIISQCYLDDILD